jgi:osmoprotectant transport system permease protein
MSSNLTELLAQLPALLGGHLLLSASALLTGILFSIPLGLAASGSRRLSSTVLAAAGVIQTIPGLALLALMVAALGGTIGFMPAYLALALYSVLPVLRNTVTGIAGADPTVIEAADGVGMTKWQRMMQVELPLAAPVIIAGIRTSTVWVVGTATLSTPVGAPSLGNYIFAGLQTRNTLSVVFGCVFAALLAIALDQLVRLVENAVRHRNKSRGLLAITGLALLIGGGLMPLVFKHHGQSNFPGAPLAGMEITIGAKTFTEQYILAEALAEDLVNNGAKVNRLDNLGSAVLFDALAADEVNLYVDYAGTLWTTILKRSEPVVQAQMLAEVTDHLSSNFGIGVVGRLGFENAYAFAMGRKSANRLGIESIGELVNQPTALTIGGDPEFFARPEWSRVRDIYGLEALGTRGMDSTFMYGAVRDGAVDVITAYTTDGRIDAFDLVVLDDPKQAFPSYDAILLVSPQLTGNAAFTSVLSKWIDTIDTALMRETNGQVDLDGATPKQAAAFLRARIDAAR